MLNDHVNENGKKINRYNQHKNSFVRAAHFFVHFFAFFCTTTTSNFLVTCFIEEMSHMFLLTFFFPCGSFLPRWLVEFLIFSLSFYVPTKFVSSDFYLLFWLFLCYPRPCHSNVTFDIDLRKDERTDGQVITKFSRVYRLPVSYPWCCS